MANGALIDIDDFVDMLGALDGVTITAGPRGAVQLGGKAGVEDLLYERTLARARNPGEAGEGPQWDADVDVLEVVLPGTTHDQCLARPLAPLGWYFNRQLFE